MLSPELMFKIVNALVLPFWAILIFLPQKKWRNTAIYAFCMFMSVIYVVYVLMGISQLDMDSFGSIEGIKNLFSQDEAVVGGWIHYLTFDLLVGNWIVNQSIKHNMKYLLVIPCLLLCFMFGPAGYLLFSLVKLGKVKSLG